MSDKDDVDNNLTQEETPVNVFVADKSKFLPDLYKSARKKRGMMSGSKTITKKKKAILLEALAQTGILAHSLRVANISSPSYYKLLNSDPGFAEEAQRAIDFSTDSMVVEAIRRGSFGVKKGVYHGGVKIDDETVYSDRLLEVMLKARLPEQFGNRTQMDVTSGGKPLQVSETKAKLLGLLNLDAEDFEEEKDEG